MARTVTWSPDSALLFTEPETATDIAYGVSVAVVDDEDPTLAVTGYAATISPEQTLMSVTDGAGGVTVTASSLAGLFPLEFIDYLLGGELERVTRWDDLPPEAQDIIEFRPSSQVSTDFVLSVTATLSDATQVQRDFTLRITQDWTAGKLRLQEEVDARRN